MELISQNYQLRKKCITNYIIANMVLKNGARLGLTLFEIGNIVFREDDDEIPAV